MTKATEHPETESPQSSSAYKVPAGEKTIDLIEYMARAEHPQTKSEIAAGMGKSMQEVYRIIQLLVDRGYLEKHANGDRFGLSMRLFSLAHRMPAVKTLSEASAGPMRNLVNNVKQSCHLGILRGTQLIVVSQFASPLNMSYSVTLGAHFPAHETGSGLVLLAGSEVTKREAFFAQLGDILGDAKEVVHVRQLVDEITQTGFHVRPSLVVDGVVNISHPVQNMRGETIAALTVPYISIKGSTLSLEYTTNAAVAGACAISEALGCPDHLLQNKIDYSTVSPEAVSSRI